MLPCALNGSAMEIRFLCESEVLNPSQSCKIGNFLLSHVGKGCLGFGLLLSCFRAFSQSILQSKDHAFVN